MGARSVRDSSHRAPGPARVTVVPSVATQAGPSVPALAAGTPFTIDLEAVDGSAGDEKPSIFPAVAGDIVFFTTTSLKPATPCTKADANLYAFTFIGGAAYDATGDNKVSNNETPKVKTIVGEGRATAPFIVDQHLWFGAGSKVSVFGDPQDFNNGVGQMGIRVLSWRAVR